MCSFQVVLPTCSTSLLTFGRKQLYMGSSHLPSLVHFLVTLPVTQFRNTREIRHGVTEHLKE